MILLPEGHAVVPAGREAASCCCENVAPVRVGLAKAAIFANRRQDQSGRLTRLDPRLGPPYAAVDVDARLGLVRTIPRRAEVRALACENRSIGCVAILHGPRRRIDQRGGRYCGAVVRRGRADGGFTPLWPRGRRPSPPLPGGSRRRRGAPFLGKKW